VKIAPNQRRELDFLRETLDRLQTMVDRKTWQNFQDLRQRLDQWAAKVAVIGQVKAGKSTFLNAFLEQHEFLPSDVNPWTSVVTNVRINLPKDPSFGARFEFFDEKDWQEIMSGGSKVRKLTEQLLPGFDTDLLQRQSEEMRERAKKRLGNYYHTLLGSKHDYDFLTPDLLKRYVCAGPGSDHDLDDKSLGRYAALTKVANLYLRVPDFQVPTILTDTPGVNDPFLVRDEFTCRSLDKSDVFIVVLSAHQPLTEVDVALIRILAKQDAKDVLIYVNRIDELDDYSTEVPRVMADVSRRLRDAIPDIEFKIVAGSAYLADLVMRDDDEVEAARASVDTPELAEYIRSRHGHVPNDRAERLLLASGLNEVKATLSEIIDNGVGTRQLGQLLGDIRAELTGTQFVAKRNRDALQLQVESIRADIAEAAAAELESEIASMRKVQSEIAAHVEAADLQIEKVVTKSWTSLEGKLLSSIETFVESQKAVFEEHLFRSSVRGQATKALEIETTPLQFAIERDVLRYYEKSRAATDVALNNCIHACRHAIKDKFQDPSENIALDDLPYAEFMSTLTLPRRTLRAGLIADRGWAFWRQRTVNIERSLAALHLIAAAELRPSVEQILAAFNEAQVERATAGMSRIQVMLRMVEDSLAEHTLRLKQDKAEMEKIAHDPEMRANLVRRLQSRMEVLERLLLNLSALDSALSRSDLPEAA
jgi:signal recognition particle receptor subunit beta